MKIMKKLLAFLLSAQMTVFAMSAAAFAEDDAYSAEAGSLGTYGSIAGPEQVNIKTNDVSFMSLLPMDKQECEVFIDRSNTIPDGLDDNSFFVYEAFPRGLTLGTSGEYEKLLFSNDGSSYRAVTLDDIISFDSIAVSSEEHPVYGKVQYGTAYFLVGYTSDDQLDNSSTEKYEVKVYFESSRNKFLNSAEYGLYNSKDERIMTYQNDVETGRSSRYSTIESQILPDALEANEFPKLRITLPSGYSASNTSVYSGFVTDGSMISADNNITADILGNGYELGTSSYASSIADAVFTFVTVSANGTRIFIPVIFRVSPAQSYVNVLTYQDAQHRSSYSSVDFGNNFSRYMYIYESGSFSELNIPIKAYFNYFDKSTDQYVDSPSMIGAAGIGLYSSAEDIIRSSYGDIKDSLFSFSYSTKYTLKLSDFVDRIGTLKDGTQVKVKEINITSVDNNGFAYHNTVYVGIIETLSADNGDTYFNVYGPNKTLPNENGYAPSYNYYKVGSSDDSYYRNGFQTVMILDGSAPVADGTVIYPEFYSGNGVKMFSEEGVQKSEYSPLAFKSGNAVQYAASAENGVNLKNYWVTYVTRQNGPKLFVNATNTNDAPKREVFLNYSSSFHHDIFFANIGDEELTGINVSLSSDTKGVKLDPYWTVIDSGVKKLAPFTTTQYDSIDNIAKIRLVPENDDDFVPVSGTLTISTENGGTINIALTGFAGVPKIVTDKLYDGVKYVPYSHVIMTNSMYGTDSISFKVSDGKLPDGIELKPNGELYGIPTTPGEYTFTVEASCKGISSVNSIDSSDSREFTITVKDNDDANVDAVNNDEQGYSLEERISRNIKVYYNGADPVSGLPYIDRIELDNDLFWSKGSYTSEFMAFYIDGQKLTEGSDYSAEEGSTKITVRSQTFGHIGISGNDVPHTLACEFRTDNKTDELKRSAQNVYLDYIDISDSDNEDNGDNSDADNSGGNNDSGTSSGGGASGTVKPVIEVKKEQSASISFTVIDADGNAVPNLKIELHSTPQYGTTDSSGTVKFDSVEFGKHTLYIENSETGKKVSHSFTVRSGSGIEIKNDVITVKEDEQISAVIRYDGEKIEILSGKADNIGSGAGIISVSDGPDHFKEIVKFIMIAAAAAVSAVVVSKKLFAKKLSK